MTAVLESRRAGRDEGDCGACHRPLERGRRIVLVRRGGVHQWVHVRHVVEHQADEHSRMQGPLHTPNDPPAPDEPDASKGHDADGR